MSHWETCGTRDGDQVIGDGSTCDARNGHGQVLVAGPDPGASDDPAGAD